jgi:pimeloyl-ACP methyl ester carboxylesterase
MGQAAIGRSFTWDGRRLAYETYGEGDRLLVLLHGLLMDARLNRGLARGLAARGHRVVLLELLGHGHSDKPQHAAEYRMDVYAEQVVALLDHVHAERAVVGGMSLGANVSLQVAAHHPQRVQGLVVEMPVLERAVPAAALTFVPALLAVHYALPLARAVNRVARRISRTGNDMLGGLLAPLASPPEVTAAVLHGILVGPTAPTVDERRSIAAPALVLGHRADLIHPFSDAEALVRQLPDARLVGARSIVELRLRPRRLLDEIDRFCADMWDRRIGPLALVGG